MSTFEGIVEIQTYDLDHHVNAKLAANQGWELLAITPGKKGPMYSLGRREVKKEPQAGPTTAD